MIVVPWTCDHRGRYKTGQYEMRYVSRHATGSNHQSPAIAKSGEKPRA